MDDEIDDRIPNLDYCQFKTIFVDGYYQNADEPFNFFGSAEQIVRVGKKQAGRLLDGVEHNEWFSGD